MNPKFIELLKKKKAEGKEVEPMEAKAKGNVLGDLMADMGEMGKDKLKGGMVKKVTVAAPSEKGLEEGLEKAKELVEGKAHDLLAGEESEEESEDEAHEAKEEVDVDALKAEIEELKKKLESLMA